MKDRLYLDPVLKRKVKVKAAELDLTIPQFMFFYSLVEVLIWRDLLPEGMFGKKKK